MKHEKDEGTVDKPEEAVAVNSGLETNSTAETKFLEPALVSRKCWAVEQEFDWGEIGQEAEQVQLVQLLQLEVNFDKVRLKRQ